MPQYHFTASYGNFINSFSILGIPDGKTPNELDRSFTCILRNILSRSDCTRPSVYLREKIGLQESEKNFTGKEFALGLIDKYSPLPRWDKTIKGAENGFNPALDFFYDDALWNRYLPGFAWVRHLIIPEAPLDKILDDFSGKWEDQTVDFYLPAAKLVIEIDGSQHRTDYAQTQLDQTRNRALSKAGITTIRIPASTLSYQDNRLDQAMCAISDIVQNAAGIQPYVLFDINDPEVEIRLRYEQILRYQFLLLQLIENGVISLRDDGWCFRVQPEDQELLALAVEDLFLWYKNLYDLKMRPFSGPKICFSDEENVISIRQSLFDCPDERDYEGIVILSDPWDGAQYSYYRVSCAEPVDYQIPWPSKMDGRQGTALRFFLKNIFGFDRFREGQWEIISSFMNRHRTIGILPTGGGKSLCYQLAALLQPGITIVVCPIISLLLDQKRNLDKTWNRTAYLQGGQSFGDRNKILSRFCGGKLQLIWIAPERMQSRGFRESLCSVAGNHSMGFAVIDEVHCLSEWGHDFRTSYLTLVGTINQSCPQATIVGLTATASQAVLDDLKIEIGIGNMGVRALPSLERENLSFEVINTKDQNQSLIDLLREQGYGDEAEETKNGIVFSLTRDESDNDDSFSRNKLAKMLKKEFGKKKAEIGVYHSGIEDKPTIQDSFIEGKLKLLSATKAFGMGVDKPDIDFTIHAQLPWSVESFYQEAGRAGRDGREAHGYILFAPTCFGSEEEINELFSPNTTPEQIVASHIDGDLKTIFYLWRLNNRGVDNDVLMIRQLRKRLNEAYITQKKDHSEYVTVQADSDNKQDNQSLNPQRLNKSRLELALYRMKLLGLVDYWLIDWRGNVSFDVYRTPQKESIETKVEKSFYDYVRRHDTLFGKPWREKDLKYKHILENVQEDYIERYARALITWTYDHILYYRRESIKDMLDYCREYKDPISFRKRIDAYLRIPEQSIILDGIVIKPMNWHLWFQLFLKSKQNERHETEETPLDNNELGDLNESLRQYRRSYQNNIGLDLIFVLSGAFNSRMDSYAEIIMENALCSIVSGDYKELNAEAIFSEIINWTKHYCDNIQRETIERLARQLVKHYPHKAREIYTQFHDRASLAVLLRARTRKIQAAMEEVI